MYESTTTKNATREIRATKKKKKRIKNKRIPSWGRVQMTQQAEIRRTIKYVLAVSTRWLLHRRRDTKKINMRGCREKKRKDRKEKRKTRYLVVYMHRILYDTPGQRKPFQVESKLA